VIYIFFRIFCLVLFLDPWIKRQVIWAFNIFLFSMPVVVYIILSVSFFLMVKYEFKKLKDNDKINKKKITIIKEIGSGMFGNVYSGLFYTIPVAIKRIKCNISSELPDIILKELAISKLVDHDNVVSYYGHYRDKNYIYLVYDLLECGDLKTALVNQDSFLMDDFLKLQIAIDIVNGMVYLQSQNINHRDLKSANMFF
jgi:serine/threonine protein kinase